ncbi:hypothetical protein B0H19DRAFT_612068 [Mycena capillaripes]|nr:hypothetical protein B0H19DRAFT_612068 [Mycena capillaripes]
MQATKMIIMATQGVGRHSWPRLATVATWKAWSLLATTRTPSRWRCVTWAHYFYKLRLSSPPDALPVACHGPTALPCQHPLPAYSVCISTSGCFFRGLHSPAPYVRVSGVFPPLADGSPSLFQRQQCLGISQSLYLNPLCRRTQNSRPAVMHHLNSQHYNEPSSSRYHPRSYGADPSLGHLVSSATSVLDQVRVSCVVLKLTSG